jgi:hypothetical protein
VHPPPTNNARNIQPRRYARLGFSVSNCEDVRAYRQIHLLSYRGGRGPNAVGEMLSRPLPITQCSKQILQQRQVGPDMKSAATCLNLLLPFETTCCCWFAPIALFGLILHYSLLGCWLFTPGLYPIVVTFIRTAR